MRNGCTRDLQNAVHAPHPPAHLLAPFRLEGLNEARQGLLQRVRIAERERDALSGDKEAAEAFLAKERQCLGHQSTLAQVLMRRAQVGLLGWGRVEVGGRAGGANVTVGWGSHPGAGPEAPAQV